MISFTAVIAGIGVEVRCRSERCRSFFGGYEAPVASPELVLSVSDGELEEISKELPGSSIEYAEFVALYEPLARFLPGRNGFVFHGACVSFEGGGYLFTAPSGTGKSTHIRLWRHFLGKNVDIVNGDKPIITVADDGGIFIHGTPWAGKERWQKNRSVPLEQICLLTRSGENFIRSVDPGEHLDFLFRQTFFCDDPRVTTRTLELLDAVLKRVPVRLLGCDISREAAKCSFEAMTGRRFEDFEIVPLSGIRKTENR